METRRNYTRQKKAYAPKVSEQGKLQPQDKELEEAVLGALMLEKDARSEEHTSELQSHA